MGRRPDIYILENLLQIFPDAEDVIQERYAYAHGVPFYIHASQSTDTSRGLVEFVLIMRYGNGKEDLKRRPGECRYAGGVERNMEYLCVCRDQAAALSPLFTISSG